MRVQDELFAAASEMIAVGGFSSLNIDELVRRANTTKPAFYRRYRNLDDLFLAMIMERFGTDPTIDTGDLLADLRDLQRDQIKMFRDPLVVQGMVSLVEALRADTELARAFVEKFLRPRREATLRVLNRAVARGEIPEIDDPEWICDAITGPILMRALLPGLPPIDERLLDQTVAMALRELNLEDRRSCA